MHDTIIRCIASAASMFIIEVVITLLYNRVHSGKKETPDNNHYVVRVPKILIWVYRVLSFFGFFLFALALITMLMGNPSATTGHLVVFLIIAAIGLLVQLWAARWQIFVHDDILEIHRLFHRCICLSVSDLDCAKLETKKMKRGIKQRILLYQSGEKIVTIDGMSEGYWELMEMLQQHGKL